MASLSYYIPMTSGWSSTPRRSGHTASSVTCSCGKQDIYGQIARITDHLFLSSLEALTPARMRQNRVTQLISIMEEPAPAELVATVERHTHVCLPDIDKSNLLAHFNEIADRIAAEARRGGRTVVHCVAGISRSSTVVIAYLMKYKRMRLNDAYRYVAAIRPCICPNPGFWRQLVEYEEHLYGNLHRHGAGRSGITFQRPRPRKVIARYY